MNDNKAKDFVPPKLRISVSVFYYLYMMKDLYTYISEAKGYLDYDNFVNDIIHEIYFNDEIKNYFFVSYNNAIDLTSECDIRDNRIRKSYYAKRYI